MSYKATGSVTVTLAVSCIVLFSTDVQVIVTLPADIAVKSPLLLIVAIDEFDVLQVTDWFVASNGKMWTDSCEVFPTYQKCVYCV